MKFTIENRVSKTRKHGAYVRAGSRWVAVGWDNDLQKKYCITLAKEMLTADRKKMDAEGMRCPAPALYPL